MKLILLICVPLLVLTGLTSSYKSESRDDTIKDNSRISTGIIMDSLGNEIFLQYENGNPKYYFSEIFTPVCETGVCLPITINVYWDLSGKYLRFDQPEGEILTKLDHVPFTLSDYRLLDEIMRGPDPRDQLLLDHSRPSKHNSLSKGASSKGDQPSAPSSPAPAAPAVVKLKLSATDMCDALTGSTLPKMRNKYVPGALYTSYTCWELANNHRNVMKRYTENNLIKESWYSHLLGCPTCGTYELTLQHLFENKHENDAYLNTLMSIVDTCETELIVQKCIHSSIAYDWQKDTVKSTFVRHYQHEPSHNSSKRTLISYWRGSKLVPPQVLNYISQNISKSAVIFKEEVELLRHTKNWKEDVFVNLMSQLKMIDSSKNYNRLYYLLQSRAKSYSWDAQLLFSTMKKP